MAYPTAADAIRRARSLLQDETVPFRYADTDFLDTLNDAVQRLVQLRPDAFVDVLYEPAVVTGTGDDLQIPNRFLYPLLLFVVGTMSLREDEFAEDGRAKSLTDGLQKMVME